MAKRKTTLNVACRYRMEMAVEMRGRQEQQARNTNRKHKSVGVVRGGRRRLGVAFVVELGDSTATVTVAGRSKAEKGQKHTDCQKKAERKEMQTDGCEWVVYGGQEDAGWQRGWIMFGIQRMRFSLSAKFRCEVELCQELEELERKLNLSGPEKGKSHSHPLGPEPGVFSVVCPSVFSSSSKCIRIVIVGDTLRALLPMASDEEKRIPAGGY